MTQETPVKTFKVGDKLHDTFVIASLNSDGKPATLTVLGKDGGEVAYVRPKADKKAIELTLAHAKAVTGAQEAGFGVDTQKGTQVILLSYDNTPS